jgi:hypothetical protein
MQQYFIAFTYRPAMMARSCPTIWTVTHPSRAPVSPEPN